ncbi:putative Ubiquitin carboxyl-terminal hydrolase 46 [Monocercomonoides exilis]|uniref:putative Ubiquitin carboxyl-terminal hydrolase 46 n=1 Tax=Monocercomonoides exilis TaxID=2049356 RepID=UPI0035595FA7|nr:putative Ubiquitin carboxyl-terminal hydrolase 46 [Monocercomonoides exilis]
MGPEASKDVTSPVEFETKINTMIGLGNLGNTCYVNSILQALYYCIPFRNGMISFYLKQKGRTEVEETLAYSLGELYHSMLTYPTPLGQILPTNFLINLKKASPLFESPDQQDAHEFLNFLLNSIHDTLSEQMKISKSNQTSTLIDQVFKGELSVRYRCLTCETTSHQHEDFLHLSVPTQQNTSLHHNIMQLANPERLDRDNKFFCSYCRSHQEALRLSRVSTHPQVLVLQLRRFKYNPEKLVLEKDISYVTIPKRLRLAQLGCVGDLWADDEEEEEEDGNDEALETQKDEIGAAKKDGSQESYEQKKQSETQESAKLKSDQTKKEKETRGIQFTGAGKDAQRGNTSDGGNGLSSDSTSATETSRVLIGHSDPLYRLSSMIVHVGHSLSSGHYISIVNCCNKWFIFNDTSITPLDPADLHFFFGTPSPLPLKMRPPASIPEDPLTHLQRTFGLKAFSKGTAYILFYEKISK